MTLNQAVILGIIEGLTEFLPVSSTAHLIFASKFLGILQTEFTTFFEVFIQSGAIIAIILLYGTALLKNVRYIKLLVVSFIPTALVGFALYPVIKTVFFEDIYFIMVGLFFIGIAFLRQETWIRSKHIKLYKTIDKMTYRDAVLIGLIQSIALLPGVSRAGIVILWMIGWRYRREDAALYSFLLAIPTILAASLYDLLKTDVSVLSNSGNIILLSIGFTASFITAFIVVKWFISFLQNNTLVPFGVYRIILTIILLLSL